MISTASGGTTDSSDLLPQLSGSFVTIRAVRLKDHAMSDDLIRQLPAESRQYRFVVNSDALDAARQKSAARPSDSRHSVAFVATIREHNEETRIGVISLARAVDGGVREVTVTVATAWQARGLATLLANQLIELARNLGTRQLYTVGAADNQSLHDMATDLGMSARSDPDHAGSMIYSMEL